MDETLRVRRVEGGRDLGEHGGRPARVEPALRREQGAEVDALDIAHRDVEDALRLACLVDRDDVRVLHLGGDPPLLLESLAEARVVGELGGQDLQRHLAPVLELLGEVDDAHPAAADQALDAEARELGPDAVVGAHLT